MTENGVAWKLGPLRVFYYPKMALWYRFKVLKPSLLRLCGGVCLNLFIRLGWKGVSISLVFKEMEA